MQKLSVKKFSSCLLIITFIISFFNFPFKKAGAAPMAPSATGVSITGTTNIGDTLTGDYIYVDNTVPVWKLVGTAGFSAGRVNYPSLAIGSNSVPYFAYADEVNSNKANVMKFNGATWELVGPAGFSAGGTSFISLALDSSNTPYVAYEDGANSNKTTVMKYDSGANAWVLVGTAGFSAGTVQSVRLVLNSLNVPYVSYVDVANSDKATVMKYDSGTNAWVLVGTAGFSGGQAGEPSLILDSFDAPYVAYADWNNSGKATVMKFNGATWELVGTAGFSAWSIGGASLFLNSSNVPYLVYKDGAISDKATVMKYSGDPEGASTYKWYRDDIEIVGATASTYVLTASDAGKTIKFEVTPISQGLISGTPVQSAGTLITNAPTLTTSAATSITRNSVVLNGTISNTGGENATTRGFEYGLTTAYGSTSSETGSFGTGAYSLNTPGLSCGKTYHFRSFATNSVGTSNGSDLTFTTSRCPSSSGSSLGSQITNLVAMGKTTEATQLQAQFPSVVTTPNSISFIFTKNLKFLTTDNDVKELQKFLNTHGYQIATTGAGSPGHETNFFGSLTKKAVIKFQLANKLVGDGIIGPKTNAVLNSIK